MSFSCFCVLAVTPRTAPERRGSNGLLTLLLTLEGKQVASCGFFTSSLDQAKDLLNSYLLSVFSHKGALDFVKFFSNTY